MKTLLLITALALFAISASAQVPTYAAQSIGLSTNTLLASTATMVTNTPVIDCRKQSTVTLQASFSGDQAGTGAVLYNYWRSVDGVTYSTTISQASLGPLAGNTVVCNFTNLSTFGCGFIKGYLTNADGVCNMTNIVLKYGIKMSAP